MIKIISLVLLAAPLAGCADDDELFAGRTMMLQSETCREHAMQRQSANRPSGEWSVNAKEANFEHDYRTCMVEEGYDFVGGQS